MYDDHYNFTARYNSIVQPFFKMNNYSYAFVRRRLGIILKKIKQQHVLKTILKLFFNLHNL